jgi:hypothetical protein
MNRSTQRKCKQWGIIAAAWLGFGLLMSCYDHLVLSTANAQGPSAQYSFGLSLLFNLGSACIGALVGEASWCFSSTSVTPTNRTATRCWR